MRPARKRVAYRCKHCRAKFVPNNYMRRKFCTRKCAGLARRKSACVNGHPYPENRREPDGGCRRCGNDRRCAKARVEYRKSSCACGHIPQQHEGNQHECWHKTNGVPDCECVAYRPLRMAA